MCKFCLCYRDSEADKPDRRAALSEETLEPERVGIFEVHTCPACGNTEVRKTK